MVKILHIEDRFHPELGYQLNFFSKYHHPDFEMTILTSDSFLYWNRQDNYSLADADSKFEKEHGVKIIRLKTAFSRKRKANLFLKGLNKTIKTLAPEIIYIHSLETWTCLRIFMMPSVIRNHVIFTDTHTLFNQFKGGWVEKFHILLIKLIIVKQINRRNIKVLYTVDENRIISLQKYGIKPENVFPCLIGTDTSVYRYDPVIRNSLRESYQISGNELVILYSGKINDLKKPHLIFDALHLILHELKFQVRIIMIGAVDQNYLQKYNLLNQGGESMKVEWIGVVPNIKLYQYYSMADFAVFPKENSLSALDVQACKLPLIMENDSTNIERLKFGGLLYEKDNIVDLAAKMEILINSELLRNKMGEEGYKYISENYNYHLIVREMEALFHRSLKDK